MIRESWLYLFSSSYRNFSELQFMFTNAMKYFEVKWSCFTVIDTKSWDLITEKNNYFYLKLIQSLP